jgi:hypothetical protein
MVLNGHLLAASGTGSSSHFSNLIPKMLWEAQSNFFMLSGCIEAAAFP